MRRLRGGIPRAFGNHRSAEGYAYGRYARAKVERLGSLPPDAAPWLKEAALLTLRLDRLHGEEQEVQAVLKNGAGRRAREKSRATLARLERRAARLRLALEAAEARLEELAARERPGPSLRELLGKQKQNPPRGSGSALGDQFFSGEAHP